MAIELGAAYVTVVPEMKGVQKQIGAALGDESASKDAGKASGESFAAGLKTTLGKVAKMVGQAFVVKKVVDFGKAAFDAYASFEQLEGGVAKLYGNSGMGIEEYAASVHSSVEQIQADYERNERAQTLVMKNAQNAWRTAGMDANTYMEQATSFSASLINSLKGDTEAAAAQTDVAMRAISDNINTFGTDAQSVTNAFQGFAKGNYTMLDNLKLGYGGTQKEMQRLIDDANAWGAANGAASDLSIESFSDVVTAIQQIQQAQGIAGTTAKEAMGTIEGSIAATKAAWQNLVLEFGKPDADIGARVHDLMDGVFGVVDEETGRREGGLLRNVTEEVATVAQNMVGAAGEAMRLGLEYVTTNGPALVSQAMGAIGNALQAATASLASLGDIDLVGMLFGDDGSGGAMGAVGGFVSSIVSAVQQAWPQVQAQLSSLLSTAGTTITTLGPQVEQVVGTLAQGAVNALVTYAPMVAEGAVQMFSGLMNAVTSILPEIPDHVAALVSSVTEFIAANAPAVLAAGRQMLSGMVGAIAANGPTWLSRIGETIGKVIGYVANAAGQMLSAAKDFMGGLITGSSEEGQQLRQWFADFFPDGLLSTLGDIGTMLLDTGKALIDGLLAGIESVAPDVAAAIQTAFQGVLDFFHGVGDFIADPIGSIEEGLSNLGGFFAGAEDTASKSMDGVAKSTGKAADSAVSSFQRYNGAQLNDKRADVTVRGNGVDGTGRDAVGKTKDAISSLSSKSVDVSVTGNAIGSAKDKIWETINAVKNMTSKTISVTTNYKTTGKPSTGGAWGGIRRHADGGVRVASKYGSGVPLDVVGERGPEAIVPLTSHYGRDFAQMVGEWAGETMREKSPISITVNGVSGPDEVADAIARRLQLIGY